MPHIDILVLSIIQGVTEFLPVGASGHTILLADFFCWSNGDPVIALARDLGVILALGLYFWRHVLGLGQGLLQVIRRKRDPRSRLLGYLLLGGLPSAVIVIILQIVLADSVTIPGMIAAMLIGFGLLLYLSDRLGLTVRRIEHLNFGNALLIGLVQCFDVIPGVSRVGVAFTAARMLGFERLEAARFALLLGLPSGLVFILYQVYRMVVSPGPLDWSGSILALISTFIAGFLAVSFLMYWLRRANVAPFVIYRVGLGLYLIYLIYRLPVFGC